MRALSLFYLVAGTLHFLRPRIYESIMPSALPAKRELVYASGAAEILGGAGVLHPRTRRAAGWWLIATLVAIFPANVNMAINAHRYRSVPAPLLWLRLPLQALLIAWAANAGPGGQVRSWVLAWRAKPTRGERARRQRRPG